MVQILVTCRFVSDIHCMFPETRISRWTIFGPSLTNFLQIERAFALHTAFRGPSFMQFSILPIFQPRVVCVHLRNFSVVADAKVKISKMKEDVLAMGRKYVHFQVSIRWYSDPATVLKPPRMWLKFSNAELSFLLQRTLKQHGYWSFS